MNKILWCDHVNETILVVLSHGTILFSAFQDMEFGNLLNFDFWHFFLGEKQLTCALILLVSSKMSVLLRAKRLPYQIYVIWLYLLSVLSLALLTPNHIQLFLNLLFFSRLVMNHLIRLQFLSEIEYTR